VRWRELKQGKKPFSKVTSASPCFPIAPSVTRIKAFIVDVFMIYLPLLYLVTYVVLGSKEAFQSNQLAIFFVVAIFGIILALFQSRGGQSPGYRVYKLRLLDSKTEQPPTFLRALWRYVVFLIAGTSLVGLMLSPFRNDGKNLHDLLARSYPSLVA